MRRKPIVAMTILLLLAACQQALTPTQRLAVEEKSLATALTTAAQLRTDGVLTRSDLQAIKPYAHVASDALDLATQALPATQPSDLQAFEAALKQAHDAVIAIQNSTKKGK